VLVCYDGYDGFGGFGGFDGFNGFETVKLTLTTGSSQSPGTERPNRRRRKACASDFSTSSSSFLVKQSDNCSLSLL